MDLFRSNHPTEHGYIKPFTTFSFFFGHDFLSLLVGHPLLVLGAKLCRILRTSLVLSGDDFGFVVLLFLVSYVILEHGFNHRCIIKVYFAQDLVNLVEALTLHFRLVVEPLEQLQRIKGIVPLVKAPLDKIVNFTFQLIFTERTFSLPFMIMIFSILTFSEDVNFVLVHNNCFSLVSGFVNLEIACFSGVGLRFLIIVFASDEAYFR